MARRRRSSKAAWDMMMGPGAYEADRAQRGLAPIVREGSREHFDATAGFLSRFGGICQRCPEPVVAGKDRVVKRGDGVIHVRCASGADDE